MQKSRFINRYILIAAAVLTFVFAPGGGCMASSRGPTLVPTEPAANEAYQEVFEVVWRTVDETYFEPEFGGLDWDAVHDEYEPMVAAARDEAGIDYILETAGE